MKKLTLSLLALLLACTHAMAQQFVANKLHYEVISTTDLTARLLSHQDQSLSGAVVIPSQVTYEGQRYRVTSIDVDAFAFCSKITSIELPASVNQLGTGLTFACDGVESLTVAPGNTTYDSRNGCNAIIETATATLMAGCKNTLITPADGIKVITAQAFRDIRTLTSLTLPEGITRIDVEAFRYTGLTTVKLPSTLTFLGDGAFTDCEDLTSIDFNGCAATIRPTAFMSCDALTSVSVPASCTLQGWTHFGYNPSLRTARIEAKSSNATNVLQSCPMLEHVVLSSTDFLNEYALYDCPNLKSVTILANNGMGNNHSCARVMNDQPASCRFIIPEGSAQDFLEQGYQNLSDLSALDMVRDEFRDEVTRIQGMASNIGGQHDALDQAISEATNVVNGAKDYPTIFAQIAAIKTAAKAFLASAAISYGPDGVDVTAAAITNPDFDRFYTGWQSIGSSYYRGYITSRYENGDVSIDRFMETWSWGGGISSSQMLQVIKDLPAGIYRLEADIIAANQYSDAPSTGVTLFGGYRSMPVATGNGSPEHFALQFEHPLTGDCKVGLRMQEGTCNWVAFDHVRLYLVGSADNLLADASEQNPLEMTDALQNPSFTDHTADGWQGNTPQFQDWNSSNNAEFFESRFSFFQTVDGLPNGRYVVKMKGLVRPAQNQAAYNAWKQGTAAPTARLFANGRHVILQQQATGAKTTRAIDNDEHFAPITDGDQTLYVPNSMVGAQAAFDAGLYDNELEVYVVDGTLTLGVASYEETERHWVIFDDFRLYYTGTATMPDLAGASREQPADMTHFITNPSFDTETALGWQGDAPEFSNGGVAGNARFVDKGFTLSQNVSGLPAGKYVLRLKGYHRPGYHESAYYDYQEGIDNTSATVTANGAQLVLPHIATGAQDTQLEGILNEDAVSYNDRTQYVPRDQNEARIFFDHGLYECVLPFTVVDGTLRLALGLNQPHAYDVVCFDDFRLYYIGDADYVAPTDVTVRAGGKATLPIVLNNAEPIRALQFRLSLSTSADGTSFTLPKKGRLFDVTLNEERCPNHSVNVSQDAETGDYTIVVTSPTDEDIIGNSGDLMYVTIQAPDNMPVGNYAAHVMQTKLTNVSGNVYQTIANNSIYGSTIQVLPFVKPGDVDGNGEVNVTDASMVIGYILGKEPAGFITEVADVDGNGLINVTDVSAIINIILGK